MLYQKLFNGEVCSKNLQTALGAMGPVVAEIEWGSKLGFVTNMWFFRRPMRSNEPTKNQYFLQVKSTR